MRGKLTKYYQTVREFAHLMCCNSGEKPDQNKLLLNKSSYLALSELF
jgi:hypothetical protein